MPTDVVKIGTTIEEQSEVERVRGMDGPQPPMEIVAQADLLIEYVGTVGGQFAPWLGQGGLGGAYLQQLPNPTDDLMLTFGARLYEEDMMRDPQVFSVIQVLVMALLCQGVQYHNPIPKGKPGFDQAEKILQFCLYCVDNLLHPMSAVRYELAEGMLVVGHKAGEMIFEPRDAVSGDYSGVQIVLRDIKPKAHSSSAFVVDGYSNVLGLAYVHPGQILTQLGAFISPDPNMLDFNDIGNPENKPRIIPRTKFVIPTNRPKNSDPRGTSHLKSVYTPYWKKQQLTPQHMAYVARFAQPSIWAKLPKEAKDIPIMVNGAITGYKSIIASTTAALAKVKGGAVASFVDTDVAMLEAQGDGKVIFDSYDHEDRQIAKGVLLQTLTTEEAKHMARAASSTHQDVFGILVQYLRDNLEWYERNDILRTLVWMNYGEKAARLYTPIVSYGDVLGQDIPAYMTALAQLALAGGVHPSMWPALRRKLDMPPADPDQEEADLEVARKTKELASEPPPPPVIASPDQMGGANAARTKQGSGINNNAASTGKTVPTAGSDKKAKGA